MKGARPCCLLTRDAAGGSFPTICVLCRVWVKGLSCCLKFGPRFLGNRLPLLPLEWRRELGVTMFLPIQDRTWDQLVRKPLTRFCWENGGHLVWGGAALPSIPFFLALHSILDKFSTTSTPHWGFPGGKELNCRYKRYKRRGFHSWVEKIPWSRKWQPTPVFLPGESYG